MWHRGAVLAGLRQIYQGIFGRDIHTQGYG